MAGLGMAWEVRREMRRITLALTVGALLATPALALAQSTPTTEDESTTTKSSSETESTTTTSESAAPAADPKADKKKKGSNVAALGAAMAAGGDKKWLVSGTLSQTLGVGAFVADPNARTVAYGYAINLYGQYILTPLVDGRLVGFVNLDMDQQLTLTSQDFGPNNRQFFVRDLMLGLNAQQWFKEKVTGIAINSNFRVDLPTSLLAQAADRVLRANLGVSAMRVFPNVGPGTVVVSLGETFRKDFGPANPTVDTGEAPSQVLTCRQSARVGDDSCLSNQAAMNYAFIHSVRGSYVLGNLSIAASVAILNMFNYDLSASDTSNVAALEGREPTQSPFAFRVANQVDLVSSSLSVSYVIGSNFQITGGFSTLTSPFIQNGNSSSSLRFPFYDFQTPENNLTSLFLDLNVFY
jgi:hypothetical protein